MVEGSVTPIRSDASRGRVLVVDDQEILLRSYGRVLRHSGFTVFELSDPRLACQLLASEPVDVMICDLMMPEMNGIELLRLTRRIDPDLPVVLVTGGGDLPSAVKAIELGAMRYLLKPVDMAALAQTCDDAVKLRQTARLKQAAMQRYATADAAAAIQQSAAMRLGRALERVHMVYQPIVRWPTRSVYAYEALVRSSEPSLTGAVELLAAAEKHDRLRDLGRAVRASVAATIAGSPSPVSVFVNLHPTDLADPQLYDAASPLSRVATSVVLELTERASLGKIGDLQDRVSELRRLGYRMAIDDLGAGYSGLAAFAQLQPDVIKLDMSLITNLDADPTKQKLVRTIRALCAELRIEVVSEGVETIAERDCLLTLGCDLLQGYLFAQPGAPFPTVGWENPSVRQAAQR